MLIYTQITPEKSSGDFLRDIKQKQKRKRRKKGKRKERKDGIS